ncbi:MAG: hypothetical protein LBQ66_03380 [Planctomycetaceae bacterium]|nr:hypothetical protein [Planctomycetaceae bacterium]
MGNRPAVGYPPYVYQHVLAFSSNLFGSITHRGGRDTRVPVRFRYAEIFFRAALRQLLSVVLTLCIVYLVVLWILFCFGNFDLDFFS